VTFGLAFLVSVTLEASFLNLEKLVFSSNSKSNLTIISNVIFSKFSCNWIAGQPREEMTAPPADEKLNAGRKKIDA
jgi:hypothetical protein